MTERKDKGIRCGLCPRCCLLLPGQGGECRIRVNVDGRLQSVKIGRAHV